MVTEEVGGRQFYDRHGAMPHFPGVASGVTIGVGYDLRFQEADDFEADWSGILTPAQMAALRPHLGKPGRSEEHTSELQSLMRISYAVFGLKKKQNYQSNH